VADNWSDDEFLGYFELHARTELALFCRAHVVRLLKMAGHEPSSRLGEWISVHSEVADPLIAEARARLAVDFVHKL
jgi:hypothetical protein